MKIERIENMKAGWFVGNFKPTAYQADFEVCYRIHPKGEKWDSHYHTEVDEINLLIRGKMKIQDTLLVSGDIFILAPYEIADPEFIEDCEIVCVKSKSMNDKVITSQ
jgi:mannose-6-phosphate isomerase-like protein (cupin superfamily)